MINKRKLQQCDDIIEHVFMGIKYVKYNHSLYLCFPMKLSV